MSAGRPAVSVAVIMGVSGSGKTTIGALLAERMGWELADADIFHSPANVAKMARGIPLDDEDRSPWLRAIAAWIDGVRAAHGHGVVTCSALKRRYRDVIVGARGDVRLVYLKGSFDVIAQRMAARRGHYMPVSLLQSQFDILEEPGPEERPIVVSVEFTPSQIVTRILADLERGN